MRQGLQKLAQQPWNEKLKTTTIQIKIFMTLEIVQKLTDSTVAAAVAKTLFPSSSFSHPPDLVSLK